MASCTKVLLSECITIGLQLKKHATRCSQVVVWLVWMGLMSAFQTMCEILENKYFPYFVGIFAGVNECSSVQNLCLSWLDLAILWPKVAKNYGVTKICVFFGADFGISLAQSAEELWRSQNLCLSGADFGISLAQSAEESWHSQNSCLSASRNAQILWCG